MSNMDFIRFYPCRGESDLETRGFFYNPHFIHHFFVSELKIARFKELEIGIYYSANSFHTYLDIKGQFEDNLPGEECQALLADLDKALFANVPFPGGFITKTQLAHLLNRPEKPQFGDKPVHESTFGDLKFEIFSVRPNKGDSNPSNEKASSSATNEKFIDEKASNVKFFDEKASNEKFFDEKASNEKFSNEKETNEKEKAINGGKNANIRFNVCDGRFELIYNSNITIDDSPLNLHRRVEWHCHWFIESMSNIIYDKSWEIFFPVLTLEESSNTFFLVGMATCYHFFNINRTRFRISQFLIFPHWQRKGLGTRLLKVIYDRAINDSEIREIAVEDPSREFSILRDLIGLRLCIEKGLISETQLYKGEKIDNISSKDIAKICKESKTQASRLAEIIMLASVKEDSDKNCMNDIFSEVRLKTKKRLKVEREEELAAVGNFKELLSEMWEEKFDEYSKTICKIRKTCRMNNVTCKRENEYN